MLKTGNFYVPLDPDYPLARTRYILEDSLAGLIVTNGTNFALATELAENGIQVLNVDEVSTSLSGDNLGLSMAKSLLKAAISVQAIGESRSSPEILFSSIQKEGTDEFSTRATWDVCCPMAAWSTWEEKISK